MSPTPDAAHSFTLPLPELVAIGGSPLYLTGEDTLRLTVFNGASGVIVTVTGRTLALGESKPTRFERTLTPATNRTASTLLIGLGDGWLLGAQVIVSSGTPLDGQTYARLSLQRGDASVGHDQFTLASDTITVGKPLVWPGGKTFGPLEGPGAMRAIAGTTPAAGADITETVPTAARWELVAFRAQLLNDANVANRQVALVLDDGSNSYLQIESTTNQTASTLRKYNFSNSIGTFITGVNQNWMLPLGTNIRMPAGHRIRTVTAGIQVGDQWSAIVYLVREWIEA